MKHKLTVMTSIVPAVVVMMAAPAHAEDKVFATGGVEVNRNGFYVYGGGGIPLAGSLDESGPLLRVFGGYGEFDFVRPATTDGKVLTSSADAMAGYQIIGKSSRVALYAGANYQHNSFRNDPLNPTRGGEWGGKVQAEVYGETGNMMLLGIGSYSTARNQYLLLAKVGFKVSGRMFIGPEAQIDGSDRYDQQRVGAHVTGFKVGPLGVSASVGYLDSKRDRDGVYGSVGVTARF